MAFIANNVEHGHECRGCGTKIKAGDEIEALDDVEIKLWHHTCFLTATKLQGNE